LMMHISKYAGKLPNINLHCSFTSKQTITLNASCSFQQLNDSSYTKNFLFYLFPKETKIKRFKFIYPSFEYLEFEILMQKNKDVSQ
jgi:hypothetical protein